MENRNNKQYFIQNDKLKIDSFLQIPKLLFKIPKYKKLSLTGRIMYSLYLNRYNDTKYRDSEGPYIIFGDAELQEFLGISRATCIRNKKELVNLNLIKIKKTTGYNKIYLMNYRNPDNNEFYTEEDLDSYAFYRFPRVFFDEQFDELTLNAKFLYTYYFDWMCLSQMNYIIDDYDRIYFRESNKDQEANLLLNNTTIIAAKKMLQASDLLIEYRNFGKEKNYYLLKLDNYNQDQLIRYNLLDKKEQSNFLKNIQSLNSSVITTPKQSIKKLRRANNIKVKEIIEMLANYGFSVSPRTYNRYEDGTRKFPKEIYNLVLDYLQQDSLSADDVSKFIKNEKKTTNIEICNMKNIKRDHINLNLQHDKLQIDTQRLEFDSINDKNDTNYNHDTQHTLIEESNTVEKLSDTNIINTKRQTNNNYTDTKINSLIKDNEKMNRIINSILLSIENMHNKTNRQMIQTCLKRLSSFKTYTIKKVTYDYTSITNMLSILLTYRDEELIEYFDLLITRIKNSGYKFKSPDNIINCFLTFMLNDLLQGKEKVDEYIIEASWAKGFISHAYDGAEERTIPVSNYKWWEQ